MKLNKKKLKSGIFITWVALLFFCNCAGKPKAFSYNFRKGSPLRKHLSEDVKIELPVFTTSNGKDEKKISFPIGTEIWKDKKGFGCLIVKYMDKRFAAFGSEAYSFIDINNLEVFTVVTDVIYEIDSQSDDYLIGIQRIPKNVDYLDVFGDSEYGDSYQILFIIRFDYIHRRYQRINILSGSTLPDSNQILSQEDLENYKNKFYVQNGILYYEKDKSKRQFLLSDFQKKSHKYKYHE
jgi:hypothetical protein